jgi:anthranilate phosphoribosyltransferase
VAPNEILTAAIEELLGGRDLDSGRAATVLAEIMAGRAGEAQTAAFLIALRAKGETAAELLGLARTMREFATPVDAGRDDLLDTAGTGGGVSTFNVSTTAALVAAAAGCAVAKHGNRSATSRSGSADVLEALGVRIDLDPEAVAESIRRVGFGFMFAPNHHPATKHVVPVRKELAVRTVFNFLGPLTNPAGASRQLIGISDPAFQAPVAKALAGLGCERGMVVCGDDGMDEISASGETRVIEVGDMAREYTFTPEELGIERVPVEALRGGEPEENAAATRAVLDGETGPQRDVVLINAAAAIYVGGRADDLQNGLEVAREAIDSGAARDLLARLVETTAELAPRG